MMLPAFVALSEDNTGGSTTLNVIFRSLASINPSSVMPKFLEKAYEVLNEGNETEKQRMLKCLLGVLHTIAETKETKTQTSHARKTAEGIKRLLAMKKKKPEEMEELPLLRHHLLTLLEAIVSSVGGDAVTSKLALDNVNIIVAIIPILDGSEAAEMHTRICEEDKQLLSSTKKLPELAMMLTDKLLKIIRTPREQERILQETVVRSIYELLCNLSDKIAEDILAKIFNMLLSNESDNGKEIFHNVLKSTVSARPESFPRFAKLITYKLRLHITPEKRRQKVLSSTAIWYANMTSALFSTNCETLIQHKDICFEIIRILIECECKSAHDNEATSLGSFLFRLTRTYTLDNEAVKKRLQRPLNEWVPVRVT